MHTPNPNPNPGEGTQDCHSYVMGAAGSFMCSGYKVQQTASSLQCVRSTAASNRETCDMRKKTDSSNRTQRRVTVRKLYVRSAARATFMVDTLPHLVAAWQQVRASPRVS
jgi:hypothetical protein